MTFLNFEDGGVRKVVIMGVTYDNLPMMHPLAMIIEERRLE